MNTKRQANRIIKEEGMFPVANPNGNPPVLVGYNMNKTASQKVMSRNNFAEIKSSNDLLLTIVEILTD